jgi:hypothetical protein
MSYGTSSPSLVMTRLRSGSTRSSAAWCQRAPELGGGVLEPEAADPLGLERLVDAHRQVDELELGREDRDVEQIGGERAQRQ